MMMLLPSKALCIFLAHQNHDNIKSNTSCSISSTRRCFLLGSAAASFLFFGQPPQAQALAEYADVSTTTEDPLYLARPIGIRRSSSSTNDGNVENVVARPSAPIEFLIPATRVGLYIYQLLDMAKELEQIKKDKSRLSSPSTVAHQKETELIEQIEKLLVSSPPTFIKSTDPTVTRRDPYNNIGPPLIGEIAIQQQKQKERKEQYTDVGITPQLFEVGELMGERSQRNRLIQAEQRRENDSEIRRAFNIYTTNLNFNRNKYVYSGSKEEKKTMIREGRLPSTNDVIRSDLDARDLYRNVVQTAVDDARAEFVYQKRVGFEEEDDGSDELVRLLNDAKSAVDSWFGFIPDEDVQLAIKVVKNEMEMEQK